MKNKNWLIIPLVLWSISNSLEVNGQNRNYYFDSKKGLDSHTGTNPDQPFKSLSKISELDIHGGDSVLLKSGSVFTEQLYFSGQGEAENPVVIGKYGGKSKPHLKGNGQHYEMVHIYNSDNIVVRDLEISNRGDKPIMGLRGLKVEIENYGEAHNTVIDNLFIHNVYGGLEIQKGGGGAMYLQNSREEDTKKSRFVNLLVENCIIEDSQRDGIRMGGQWIRGKWYPNLGVVIRNNQIDGVPGDGIVVSGCDGALIEYNTLQNFPATLPPSEACDGIWPWSSDNTLVQYNVVSDHHSIVDGYAYDSDWNCRNTVFQYNLSYNNIGGFMLVIATDGWPDDWSVNGNYDTQIRYNISINDGLRNYKTELGYFSPVMHITGRTKNTNIEKNIFYLYPKPSPEIDKTLLHFTEHDGAFGEGDVFHENSIYVSEPTHLAKEEQSKNNDYEDNHYVGPLTVPEIGFTRHEGKFNSELWCNKGDGNWKKLLDFVRDKTVPINGEEISVLEIIGYKY